MKACPLFFRTDFKSTRLRYILNEILGRRLGLQYLPADEEAEIPSGSVCLHYGIPGGDIAFPDSGILRESGIGDWQLRVDGDLPVLIHQNREIREDLFGASFWLLSRYEEQTGKFQADAHGRFPDEAHSALSNIRDMPLIEFWVDQLRMRLQSLGIQCKKSEALADFSIDWDNPTAYLQKGIFRQAGGIASDLLKANFNGFSERLKVLSRQKPDPYDNLGSRIRVEILKGKRIFFWVGEYGKHDKGLSWENVWYQQQIQKLSEKMIPGLHPSYASFKHPEKLAAEKKRLEAITGKEITASRFHFLRFRLPESYRILEEAGIREDFSMGFSEFPGFRAGTALPFHWFDLERNQAGNLLIHPFSLMDSSRAFREGSNEIFLNESKRQLKKGQDFAFPVHAIFHNEHPVWPGWENTVLRFCGITG